MAILIEQTSEKEMKQDILGMDDLTDLDDMDIEFDEGW